MIESRVIVIGAGPGGLGTAARLSERGNQVALLEQGDDVAASWRQTYDSLRLNTSSVYSYLPGRRFPRRLGMWISRDDLVAYYRAYAASHNLPIYTGVTATRVEQIEDGWEVHTSQGAFRGHHVVVATGKHHTPIMPAWSGLPTFPGTLMHAAEYRNAGPFRGQRILIVGVGNSGKDIAIDLARGGAAKVWVSARRAPHLIRRQVLGLPHDALSVATRRLPERILDRSARLMRRLTIGDLDEVGLPLPRDGAATRFATEGRVPTIDGGDFIETVRSGEISIIPGIERFEGDIAILRDGSSVAPGGSCGRDGVPLRPREPRRARWGA